MRGRAWIEIATDVWVNIENVSAVKKKNDGGIIVYTAAGSFSGELTMKQWITNLKNL